MSQQKNEYYRTHFYQLRDRILNFQINYDWDQYGFLPAEADELIDFFQTVLPGAKETPFIPKKKEEYDKLIETAYIELNKTKFEGSITDYLLSILIIHRNIRKYEYERDYTIFTKPRVKYFIFVKYYTALAMYNDKINRFIRGDYIEIEDYDFVHQSILKIFNDQLNLDQILKITQGVMKFKGLKYVRNFPTKDLEEWDDLILNIKTNGFISYEKAKSAVDFVLVNRSANLELNKLLFQKAYDFATNIGYRFYYLASFKEKEAKILNDYNDSLITVQKLGVLADAGLKLTQLYTSVLRFLIEIWDKETVLVDAAGKLVDKGVNALSWLIDNIELVVIGGLVLVGYLLYSGTVEVPYVNVKKSDD